MMRNNSYSCRSCGSKDLKIFLELGKTPLADRFLTVDQLVQPEPKYPLEIGFCSNCNLVQILETVHPEELFCDNYPYYSSFSAALLDHSRQNVLDLIQRRGLTSSSFVVELASNDGYLLKNYVEKGIPCLGIDPADGPAKAANENGVTTLNTFFTKELATQLRDEGKVADVIHANNVLAHVADTNGFVEGISILLKDDGVAVIEFPYVKDLIDQVEFDTIYHEHLCYFSVSSVVRLLRRHGLYLNEVKRFPIHGGSLRLYVERRQNIGQSVRSLIEVETAEKMDQFGYYEGFAHKVEDLKTNLLAVLNNIKSKGKKIAGYGAAAKGSTLINYIDIDKKIIDYVVDRNTHKHGKYMPGKRLPIYPVEKLIQEMPDYVLILAWNFAEEIMEQQQEYKDKGGRFIVPIPEPKII
jgi:SAM-dependent methyltransferase